MASMLCFLVFTLFSFNSHQTSAIRRVDSNETNRDHKSFSILARKQPHGSATMASLNYKSNFKYSMALIVTLPIGTPPQNQQMVLDTGSQLSWIQCHKKSTAKSPAVAPPRTAAPAFDPTLSSSFSVIPCNHPMCKPRNPDFTLPTTCDQKQLCHYSYFYADGTYAEGNLVKEKISLSNDQTTPLVVLGCAAESREAEGILGMNLGHLSFASQAKVDKFSYCVPARPGTRSKPDPTGAFYLGPNPNSRNFQYIPLLTFSKSQRMPNLDPLAYTVPLAGIRIGREKLNIPATVFRPDAGGSGQTMIDSGTEYTFLVDAAHDAVKEHVTRLAGARFKKGYVYGGCLEMCFSGGRSEIGRLIGKMAFEFDNGVEILIGEDNVLETVSPSIHCLGIGRSELLGVTSNIIGNFHQQNLWVEFDLIGQRVGLGKADCSRA